MIYHHITKTANGQLFFLWAKYKNTYVLPHLAKHTCIHIANYNLFTSSIALGNCSLTSSTTTFGTIPILSIQVPLGV